MNKTQRILSKIYLAVSLFPWFTLAYFTLYAFLTRLFVGHWPQYWEPETDWSHLLGAYGNPVRDALWWGSGRMLALLVLSVPAFALFTLPVVPSRLSFLQAFVIYIWGWVALLFVGCFEPTGFVVWLYDAKWPH